MGESSSRVKIGMTIFLHNFASKSGFRTSSKVFESTSMQGSPSPMPRKHEYYSL
jgi:hypothetical protein